jgi:ParB family chromosome partitioning protein
MTRKMPGPSAVMMLPLTEVRQNPLQPRRHFDQQKLEELAASIREHGVVQPVVVTREVEGYRLVVGERRFRASRLAGLETIPALVKELAGQQLLEIALIENLQREDLNPIEEAQAFSYLIKEHKLTQEVLARRLGCSRPAVTNSIRLLSLPTTIREDLEAGMLSVGHARALLALRSEGQQQRAWQEFGSRHLSVRQAEEYIRRALAEPTPKASEPTLSPDWLLLQQQLGEQLRARVLICPKSKGRGKIELHYRDQVQLETLIEALVALAG